MKIKCPKPFCDRVVEGYAELVFHFKSFHGIDSDTAVALADSIEEEICSAQDNESRQ